MAHLTSHIENCGIMELAGIEEGGAKETLRVLTRYWFGGRPPFLFFSTATKKGEILARYIKRRKFGKVVGGSIRRNNPTGSKKLRVWIFAPDYNEIRKRL